MTDRQTLKETLAERGKTYGNFYDQSLITQGLLVVIKEGAKGKGFAPDQKAALEMIVHKIARIVNGDPDHIDSWLDIAGYSMLVADRLERDKSKEVRGYE